MVDSEIGSSAFHDDQMPEDERRRFHAVYNRFADAVSESLKMFLWVVGKVTGACFEDGSDNHACSLLLMYDLAEAIDGVSVLARAGCAKNCPQMLRTAFEIDLGLRYMLQTKDTYEHRCRAYEFYHLRDKLRWEERCDSTTQSGKSLRGDLKDDPFVGIFDVKGRNSSQEIADLKTRMDSPRYAAVRDELTRSQKAKKRVDNWFSLWDGPQDIRRLSIELQRGSIYDSLYRSWSNASHGEGAVKRIRGQVEQHLQIDAIRSPVGLSQMCKNACQIANGMALFLVAGLLPQLHPQLREIYINTVKPGLESIDGVRL